MSKVLKGIVLSKYEENGKMCYLIESNLFEYLSSLKDNFDEYDIQRGIVNNKFLDKLKDTLKNKKLIPPIVLLSEKKVKINDKKIEIKDFEILDGLQRTYRLKEIFDKKEKYEFNNKDFENYKQWFLVWEELNKAEQIDKMILLNAGQKSMDLKHQLELIFKGIIHIDKIIKKCSKELEDLDKCSNNEECLVYSKSYSTRFFYRKKIKNVIHFAFFIDAIIAFEKCKPFTINQKALQDIQENVDDYERIKKIIESNNIIMEIKKIFLFLDDIFCNDYNEKGMEFLGRESVIVGLFAAFGKFIETQIDYNNFNENQFIKILDEIQKKLHENIQKFDLDKFDEMKKRVDITSFNIGDIMKEVVYYFVIDILFDFEKIKSFSDFPVNDKNEYRKFIYISFKDI